MSSDAPETVEQLSREELESRLHKLEDAYQRCQRLSLSNNYAAAVMHEVNNPLEAITNLVYLAQHDDSASAVQSYLALVQEQLVVLASVARSSLAFYKGQDEARGIDLVQIAESALKLHFGQLNRARIIVEKNYCKDAALRGIGSEILQIVSNLLLNAADALTEVPAPAIRIDVRRTRNTLHFTVRDNGPGVPEEVERRLFQAHTTGKKTGTGLGLWLSRRLAEKHGGVIRFCTSRKAGASGTIFSLALPT